MAPDINISDRPPSIADLLAARPHLTMHAMDGLTLEGAPLNAIADQVGTPVWVYGFGTIRSRLRSLNAAMAGMNVAVHFAMKANDSLAVLKVIGLAGAGVDVVSSGELRRALAAGISAQNIVFSGVGKTAGEMAEALAAGIAQLNVESAEELETLSAVAVRCGRVANVALRVNPDVAAPTHTKIATGRAGDKFGIAHHEIVSLYAHAAGLPGLRPVGLAVHIGSQIVSAGPFRDAYARIAGLVRELRQAGLRVEVVDCGGGLGIGYRDEPGGSPAALAGAIRATLADLDLRLMIEPGRWLVGPAGVLLASVVRNKRTGENRFVILDAAMNDLIRPAMYEAWHGIVPVSAADAIMPVGPADIVGPVCESGDLFARARPLPDLAPGARVAILDSGAYGAVMSSAYNARPLAAEVMVDGDTWAVIRQRQPVEDLWARDVIPPFLK